MSSWSVIGLSWRMPDVSKVCWFERRNTLSSEFVVSVDLVAVVIGWCRLRMSMVLLKSIVCDVLRRLKLRSPARIKLLQLSEKIFW